MNVLASIIFAVTPIFVNHNDVAGDTQVMTNISEWAEGVQSGGDSWSRPNEWMVSISQMSSVTNEVTGATEMDSYKVYSNVIHTTTASMSAQCSVKVVDETAMETPSVTWSAMTPNGTITTNGIFTANNDGIYRVSATAKDGVVRYGDVAINSDRISVSTNNLGYFGDKEGTVRKVVNDEALAVLQNATFVSTNSYNGIEYYLYNTFVPKITGSDGVGIGVEYPTALSQNIMISAAHWIGWRTLPIGQTRTFNDGNGNVSTVTMGEWVNLVEWAKTNGFTDVEAAAATDIALIKCDKATSIPDGCIPYLMDMDTAKEYFGEGWNGVSCWTQGQNHPYAIPLVITTDSYEDLIQVWWPDFRSGYNYYRNNCRQDYLGRINEMGQQYIVHGGDSGRPIFMMYNNKPILLGTFYSSIGHSNTTKAFEIIKKFVEAYGNTIKDIKEAN